MYGLVCGEQDCKGSYVGETNQALKARVNQHRKPYTNEAHNYLHMKENGHLFNIKDATILDKEE